MPAAKKKTEGKPMTAAKPMTASEALTAALGPKARRHRAPTPREVDESLNVDEKESE